MQGKRLEYLTTVLKLINKHLDTGNSERSAKSKLSSSSSLLISFASEKEEFLNRRGAKFMEKYFSSGLKGGQS